MKNLLDLLVLNLCSTHHPWSSLPFFLNHELLHRLKESIRLIHKTGKDERIWISYRKQTWFPRKCFLIQYKPNDIKIKKKKRISFYYALKHKNIMMNDKLTHPFIHYINQGKFLLNARIFITNINQKSFHPFLSSFIAT